jgi:hypothetical protein
MCACIFARIWGWGSLASFAELIEVDLVVFLAGFVAAV